MSSSSDDYQCIPLDALFAGQLETMSSDQPTWEAPGGAPGVWIEDDSDDVLEWAFVLGLLWAQPL